eukprot:6183653-Pleurochrysis_carterae.AAC.2
MEERGVRRLYYLGCACVRTHARARKCVRATARGTAPAHSFACKSHMISSTQGAVCTTVIATTLFSSALLSRTPPRTARDANAPSTHTARVSNVA